MGVITIKIITNKLLTIIEVVLLLIFCANLIIFSSIGLDFIGYEYIDSILLLSITTNGLISCFVIRIVFLRRYTFEDTSRMKYFIIRLVLFVLLYVAHWFITLALWPVFD